MRKIIGDLSDTDRVLVGFACPSSPDVERARGDAGRLEDGWRAGDRTFVLTLFVNGASDLSVRAIGNVRALCEQHLAGRYRLEVVDVHRDAV